MVLAGNLVGALVVGWVAGHTAVFEPAARAAFAALGREAMVEGFWTTLLRGVVAGWLIALIVWLLPFAETARVAVIFVVAYVVGLGQFPQIVTAAVASFYSTTTGVAAWSEAVWEFLVPTLIGNVVGGVVLVAVLNHEQAVAGSG